jgi:M6 family metalloprotease-like protein
LTTRTLLRKGFAIFAVAMLVLPRQVRAVKHINSAYPHPRQDDIHHPSSQQVARFGSLQAAIIGASSGPKTVAVVVVQFPSASSSWTSGSKSIQSLPTIDSYFTKMNQYYQEVSHNAIPSLTFKFFGPNTGTANGDSSAQIAGAYTLASPMEYYGCGDEGQGCSGVGTPTSPSTGANGDYLIRDAIAAARAGHSNTPAASNSGGLFDAVIVMHAGYGNETTRSNGDIWSIFYSQDSVIPTAGGGFTEGDVVPEIESDNITSPLGVMCHEFGHELGLPDLYNTTVVGGNAVVGSWELMDAGPYDGAGANPSHMGAWDKMHLGWLAPSTSNFSLPYVETGNAAVKIPVQDGLPEEYFLVEYRSPTSGALFDRNIPGTGLLIWHVDDALTSSRGIAATDPGLMNTVNSGTPHYGVSIVTQDGETISNSAPGNATNVFSNGENFTTPKSNNFAGQPSGVSVVKIAGVGSATASFEVVNLAVGASQSILKLTNYPNPAGKGYNHPSGQGHTTVQFQLTRPANDYQINIYTLSGDLVRKVDESQINLNTTRSSDDKWVYEFDWDLKNGDGQMVAPGVYLILARADGQSKSAKAVIIR